MRSMHYKCLSTHYDIAFLAQSHPQIQILSGSELGVEAPYVSESLARADTYRRAA
jgi:hypothetical protein